MTDRSADALEAMNEAVLAIAAERSVERVLERIVEVARGLARARYAALGIPDGEGGFAQFITSGMTDEEIAAMGPLPRTHGLLGAMLESEASHRTNDISQDPRFRGWWPRTHPRMRSFLGVPIVSRAGIIAAFYLTDREGAGGFSAEDQHLIEMLAAHAALAIESARLYERSRELSAVEERNRLARDLHDSVVQKLFGIALAARSASMLLEQRDAGGAHDEVERLGELAQEAIGELRSLVFQLRPAAVETDGLTPALRKHVEVLKRVHRQEIVLEGSGGASLGPGRAAEVFRIAQEALSNALRHSHAGRIAVRLSEPNGRLWLTVEDDGVGFEPESAALRSRRLGLTSMEERAGALGGRLTVESRPGAGATIGLEVPLGEDSRADRG
jgi:signal transduction histidine kinase